MARIDKLISIEVASSDVSSEAMKCLFGKEPRVKVQRVGREEHPEESLADVFSCNVDESGRQYAVK